MYKLSSSQSINRHQNHQPQIRNVEKPKDLGRLVELWIPSVESHAHLFVGKGMALQKWACSTKFRHDFPAFRPAGEFFISIARLHNDFDFFLTKVEPHRPEMDVKWDFKIHL